MHFLRRDPACLNRERPAKGETHEERPAAAGFEVFQATAEVTAKLRARERNSMGRNSERHHSAAIGFLATLGLAVGYIDVAAAQAPTVIRYGVDTERNINALSQVIAERQGFLAREGIKLEPVRFLSGADRASNRSAMVATRENFDMTRGQVSFVIEEGLKGSSLVAVAAVVNNPVYFMVARPDIKTFADLKGKSLVEPSAIDPITLTARKLMEMHGLKEGDVDIKYIGGSEPRVACLKSGACAAGSLSQPAVFAAFDAGFHTLGMHTETGPLLYVVEIVDRSWAEAHGDVVVRYLRATGAATRFIHDPRNRDDVVKAAMELTGQPENRAREMLSYVWDDSNHVLPRQGEIDMDALKAMIALHGRYGILQNPLPAPERFVDLRYARMAGIQ
jgi:ABC-type nitrate/sulfonate/bicarbonate transport system substrate-binding protein